MYYGVFVKASMEYLLAASFMSAPAALVAAKMTVPVSDSIVNKKKFKIKKLTQVLIKYEQNNQIILYL